MKIENKAIFYGKDIENWVKEKLKEKGYWLEGIIAVETEDVDNSITSNAIHVSLTCNIKKIEL